MAMRCGHLERIVDQSSPAEICEECVAEGSHEWVHLRQCRTCGGTRCCDQSPNRHASRHFASSRHPVIRSAEPDEDWHWCYIDELVFRRVPR